MPRILVGLLLFPIAQAIYVGTILLPHGDFSWDPEFCVPGSKERNTAEEIASAARRAARWLLDQRPDIVLLTTPHGLQLDYDYGIYHGSIGSGSVSIGQDLIPNDDASKCNGRIKTPYNVSLSNLKLADTKIGDDLLLTLKQENSGYPVSAIYSPNSDTPFPIFWGEIIPLLILLEESQKAGTQELPFESLIWTFPHRRYTQSPEMVPELLRIGADTMKWMRQRRERIAVVVSGDLAHTHLQNGPYGYSDASAAYDNAIAKWSGGESSPCHPEAEANLLDKARSLQPRALSCGFTGYVLWHGMMMCDSKDEPSNFQSTLLANGNVTYYGMCAAFFAETAAPKKWKGRSVQQRI